MLRLHALLLSTLVAACSASSPSAPSSARADSATPAAADCNCSRLDARLERLHQLALAEDELPSRVTREYRELLDGLRPARSHVAGAFTVDAPPYSPTLSPVIHHAPRFQGEEVPRLLHWNHSPLGPATSPDIGRSLTERIEAPQSSVVVALWRNTSASELDRLFGLLADQEVDTINLIGRQDVPSLAELDPPAEAAALFERMKQPDGRQLAARTRATWKLEQLVFESSGRELEITSRVIEPNQSLAEQSRAYIEFLLQKQMQTGCSVPDDHLVWLYRARFIRDPLAIVPVSLAEARPLDTQSDPLQEIVERLVSSQGDPGD